MYLEQSKNNFYNGILEKSEVLLRFASIKLPHIALLPGLSKEKKNHLLPASFVNVLKDKLQLNYSVGWGGGLHVSSLHVHGGRGGYKLY